jgi:hypothetical protein
LPCLATQDLHALLPRAGAAPKISVQDVGGPTPMPARPADTSCMNAAGLPMHASAVRVFQGGQG